MSNEPCPCCKKLLPELQKRYDDRCPACYIAHLEMEVYRLTAEVNEGLQIIAKVRNDRRLVMQESAECELRIAKLKAKIAEALLE